MLTRVFLETEGGPTSHDNRIQACFTAPETSCPGNVCDIELNLTKKRDESYFGMRRSISISPFFITMHILVETVTCTCL